jgi:hypothetical protein
MGNLLRFELLPGNRYVAIGVAPLIDGVDFGGLPAYNAFDANWIIEELEDRNALIWTPLKT